MYLHHNVFQNFTGTKREELGAKLIVYASLFDARCGAASPGGVLKPSIHFGIVGEGLAEFRFLLIRGHNSSTPCTDSPLRCE